MGEVGGAMGGTPQASHNPDWVSGHHFSLPCHSGTQWLSPPLCWWLSPLTDPSERRMEGREREREGGRERKKRKANRRLF